MMGAAEVQGIQSRGVLPTVKHFVANEQETHRSIGGDLSWLSEQALREIYLKPFEYTVKLGETRGIMTSFNRIGTRWTGGDYRLLTEILRSEWGFNGLVVCDFNTIPQYMIPRMMFYAGGSLDLATQQSAMWTDCDTSDAGDAIVLMRAVKDVMYATIPRFGRNTCTGLTSAHSPSWASGWCWRLCARCAATSGRRRKSRRQTRRSKLIKWAAILDESPEGCFLCGGDDPDFITIISKPVALCVAPHILPPFFCISRFHNFHNRLTLATISRDSHVRIVE